MRLSGLHLKFGDYEAASKDLEKIVGKELVEQKTALKQKISRAEALLQDTRNEFTSAKWKAVDSSCRNLLTDYSPYSREIYDMRIKALTMLKDWQRAIDVARSKARVESDRSETDFLVGKIYLSMGNMVLGRKFVTECAKSNHEKGLALYRKLKQMEGVIEEADKKMLLKDAVAALESLLQQIDSVSDKEPFYDETFPSLFEGFRIPVLKLLCAKYARRKQVDQAVEVCGKAKALDSQNQEFYLLRLGELFLSQDKHDEAIDYIQQAQRINPRDKEARELLQKAQKQKQEKARTKYYDLLGVPQDASVEQITKAYKGLVRKWHPDKQLDKESKQRAEEKMKAIHNAYEVLSNEQKRAKYDRGFDPNDPHAGSGFSGGAGSGGFGFGDVQFNVGDFSQFFKQAQRQQGHQGGRNQRKSNRGHSHYYYHDDL